LKYNDKVIGLRNGGATLGRWSVMKELNKMYFIYKRKDNVIIDTVLGLVKTQYVKGLFPGLL